MSSTRPLVIIGGGPAGMAAAIEAARAGVSCTLIDEAPRLGGQIYRQPPREFDVREPGALGKDFTRGQHLREAFGDVSDRVKVLSGTSVLGIWAGGEILYASEEASDRVIAERLILATGAHDRPVPFPGWTLPGVMALIGTLRNTLAADHTNPMRNIPVKARSFAGLDLVRLLPIRLARMEAKIVRLIIVHPILPHGPIRLVRMVRKTLARRNLIHHPHEADGVFLKKGRSY